MTKAKHTPGPWYGLPGRHHISIRHKTGDKNLPMINVASVRGQYTADCPYGTSEGNARLILAAPDLLDALQVVVDQWASQFEMRGHMAPSWCKQARAAIAKATGIQN